LVPEIAVRARKASRLEPDLFAWLGVIGAAWIAAYWLEVSGAAHLLHHHTIYHGGQIVAGGLALLGVWQVMTAAMMLPGTLPAVMRISARASQLAFIATYSVGWTCFAFVAFAGDMGLHALVHGWQLAAEHENLIPAGILGMAAAYEVTPWKQASLAACRRPLKIHGSTYARDCLASGWALMLIMFSAGVADLAWMVALAMAMLAEKTLPSGERLRYVVAAALALLAIGSLLGVPLL
jgi:predicted metal-binding membrane protein